MNTQRTLLQRRLYYFHPVVRGERVRGKFKWADEAGFPLVQGGEVALENKPWPRCWREMSEFVLLCRLIEGGIHDG